MKIKPYTFTLFVMAINRLLLSYQNLDEIFIWLATFSGETTLKWETFMFDGTLSLVNTLSQICALNWIKTGRQVRMCVVIKVSLNVITGWRSLTTCDTLSPLLIVTPPPHQRISVIKYHPARYTHCYRNATNISVQSSLTPPEHSVIDVDERIS